jgi:hypothetical protein
MTEQPEKPEPDEVEWPEPRPEPEQEPSEPWARSTRDEEEDR